MRSITLFPGEYYHVYNRGTDKRDVFLDDHNYLRFLFSIMSFQSFKPIVLPARFVAHWKQVYKGDPESLNGIFSPQEIGDIATMRIVELVAFALMPNHFHLLLKEIRPKGISEYMQRIQCSYTKYFNTLHDRSGHLFQGPFQAVHVESNEQLLHLTAYIHRNPSELFKWAVNPDRYPWSSYQDYVYTNRWSDLLNNVVITSQLKAGETYHQFVLNSGAKMNNED